MLNLGKIIGILLAFTLTFVNTVAENLFPFTERRPALGSVISITCYANDSTTAREHFEMAFELVDSFNLVFSDYNPSSEILKICRQYSPGKLNRVSDPLFDLIEKAQEIKKMTNGSFDIAIGALTNLWRSYLADNRIPPRRLIRRFRRHLDNNNIELQYPDLLRLMKANMRLDFGGIAKGYIADQIANLLREQGIKIFLIDLGGDLVVGDPPPGSTGWKITISWCDKIVEVKNQAIATSGPDFQFFVHKGERYAHIIDPKTGWGVSHLFGSTVIADSGYEADALASAFSVSTLAQTKELLQRKVDIAAIIGINSELFESDNFSQYVVSDSRKN